MVFSSPNCGQHFLRPLAHIQFVRQEIVRICDHTIIGKPRKLVMTITYDRPYRLGQGGRGDNTTMLSSSETHRLLASRENAIFSGESLLQARNYSYRTCSRNFRNRPAD